MKKYSKQMLCLWMGCLVAVGSPLSAAVAHAEIYASATDGEEIGGGTPGSMPDGAEEDSMGEDVPPEYLKQLQNGEGFGDSSGSDVIDETGNSVSDTEAPPEEGDAEGAGQGSSGEAQGTEGAGQETGGDAQGADDSSQGTEEDSQGTEAASPLNQAGEVTEPITKEDKPYLALGANLTQQQQATVLSLLGINPAELSEYDVIYITNEEEHQYLGNYVDTQKIGTRALSSVLIVKREKGNGIRITTKNISYCTIGMYKNALITAGITDADILVAGPTPISGTAALVGAMKAYAVMTGEEVTEESMDTALNELVLTGDIADTVGDSEKAEELIAYLKQEVIGHNFESDTEIREVIEDACDQFQIKLSESEIQELINLLKKIDDLDLDLDSIKKQAESLYKKLSELDIDTGGFFEKVKGFFQAIVDFFKGLFS